MTPQAPARSLRLPVLLDQQFWFLGHDIRHEAGNALERFGFTRWRHPHGVGTSCYVLTQGPDSALVCWGFAAYLGTVSTPSSAPGTRSVAKALAASSQRPPAPAGILVQRHSMAPRIVLAPPALPVHRLTDLPRSRSPQSRTDWAVAHAGLQMLARVFARYEQWAHHALGEPYRLDTLRGLPRHKRRKFERVADLSMYWGRWLH